MKKLLLFSFLSLSALMHGQQFPFVGTNISGAERISAFQVSGFPLQRFEITNATVDDDRFIPALWAHNGYTNSHVIQYHATTTSTYDTGNEPLFKFIASIPTTINLNAPSGTQFPWGDGMTQNSVLTRPTFSWINGENTIMLLSAQNYLGLGTTNPTARFHSNGTVRLEGLSTSSSDLYVLTSDTNGNLKRQLKSTIGGGVTNNCGSLNYIVKNGSTGLDCSLIFDNGTNVGIGTSTPLETLHINGNIRGSQTSGALRVQTTQGYLDIGAKTSAYTSLDTDRASFRFNKDVDVTGGIFNTVGVGSALDLKLQTNGVNRIYATNSNGFVGIGTNSPQEILHINGNIRGNQTSGALRVQTTQGFLDIGAKNFAYTSLDTDLSSFRFNKAIGVAGGVINSIGGIGSPSDLDLKLQTNSVNRIYATNSNGYVGIGTDTPQERLHINGNIRGDQTSGALKLQTATGYLTLGPQNATTSDFITDVSTFKFNKKVQITGGELSSGNSFIPAEMDLKLQTNGTTRIIANNSTGYVGVNTPTPSANFHSKGTLRFENLTTQDTQYVLGIDNNGYVYLNSTGGGERVEKKLADMEELVENQKERIDKLESLVNDLLQEKGISELEDEKARIVSVSPVPSNDNIEVFVSIPQGIKEAQLIISSPTGALLNSIKLNANGKIRQTIAKENYNVGLYFVNLVVEGKIIDSKKIIFN